MIELRSVSKEYISGKPPRGTLAISDVDLTIAKGEILSVIGPSGCGKSTILNLVAGLLQPTGGQVLYDGAPISGANHRVGYITQRDNLMPWRTVAGNVAFPLELRGVSSSERRSRVADALGSVGLSEFADAYPIALSGGMRKRVTLARTVVYEPETILADEPFAALDAQLKLRLLDLFQSICTRIATTVVFVTHDLAEAITFGDRVIVFSQRPARIIHERNVTFPRPRDVHRLRLDPGFIEAYEELLDSLMPTEA